MTSSNTSYSVTTVIIHVATRGHLSENFKHSELRNKNNISVKLKGSLCLIVRCDDIRLHFRLNTYFLSEVEYDKCTVKQYSELSLIFEANDASSRKSRLVRPGNVFQIL